MYKYKDLRKEKIKKIVIIALCAILLITSVFLFIRHYQKKKAEQYSVEWFIKQSDYLNNLMTYSENMDDVVSLYLSGNMSEGDFVLFLQQFQGEINLLKADRDKYLKKHPVRLGSETKETNAGAEAVDEIFKAYTEMIPVLEKYRNDKETLAYNYLAYEQVILRALSKYVAARYVVYENAGILDKIPRTDLATPSDAISITPEVTPGISTPSEAIENGIITEKGEQQYGR